MRGKAVGKFPGMVLRDLSPFTYASGSGLSRSPPPALAGMAGPPRSSSIPIMAPAAQHSRRAAEPHARPPGANSATIAAITAEYGHISMCTAAWPVPVCHRRRWTEISFTPLGRTGTANRLALTQYAGKHRRQSRFGAACISIFPCWHNEARMAASCRFWRRLTGRKDADFRRLATVRGVCPLRLCWRAPGEPGQAVVGRRGGAGPAEMPNARMQRHADLLAGRRIRLGQGVAEAQRPVRRDVRVVGAAFEGDGRGVCIAAGV